MYIQLVCPLLRGCPLSDVYKGLVVLGSRAVSFVVVLMYLSYVLISDGPLLGSIVRTCGSCR